MNILYILSASLSNLTAQLSGLGAADVVADGQFMGIAGGFGGIAETVAYSFLPFVDIVAVLVIIVAGLLAVVAQDESRIANARKVVAMALSGLILVNLAAAFTLGYMRAFDVDNGPDPTGGAGDIAAQFFGVIAFLETPAAVIAIVTIIAYGIKALVDYNGDQGLAAFKKAVLSVLMGIVLIMIKFLVADSLVVFGTPEGIIDPMMRILLTILSFTALVGVIVIAIAGMLMVVNIGDESRFETAKKVIISVTAGLILMAVVFGLIGIIRAGTGVG